MSNIWVGSVAVVIAALTLVINVVLEVRRRAENRNAERAKTAAELAAILQELGAAGLDKSLDSATAMSAHQNQIERLQIAVRRNAAAYADTAMRQGMGPMTLFLLAFYGLGLMVVAAKAYGSVSEIDPSERWVGVLIAFLIWVVGLGGLCAAVWGLQLRWVRDSRTRAAGVSVPRWRDEVREIVLELRLIPLRRRRRRETERLKRLANPHPARYKSASNR